MSTRVKLLVVAATTLVLTAVAVVFAVQARHDAVPAAADAPSLPTDGHHLLVVRESRLATLDASDPSAAASRSDVSCVRSYFSHGTGVCIRQDSPWSYSLHVLDASLRDLSSRKVRGLPSRARVSPGGRMVAWTAFISGESYAQGGFSTRTGILDTATGEVVANLETFAIERDGKPYRAADVNFWGVTFAADENRFYATLDTDGVTYLVEGDFAARSVRTVATGVECPSLSPDGTRIAFKLDDGHTDIGAWRPAVIDLRTRRVTPLAEARGVDDQPVWLDDDTVGYAVRDAGGRPSVWSVPADGTGRPRLIARNAESPAPL